MFPETRVPFFTTIGRALSVAAIISVATTSGSLFAGDGEAPPPRNWKKDAKNFKFYRASKDIANIARLVDEVAQVKSAKACEVILSNVPFGLDVDLERKVGKHLVNMKSEEARKVLYDALENHQSYKTRIVLAAVAFHQHMNFEYPEALEGLVKRLGDSRVEVVLAAIRWLGKAQSPKAVSALIKLLAREEKRPHGRVYLDTKKVLEDTTGESLQLAADWKNYWSARQDGVPVKSSSSGRTTRLRKKPAEFFNIKIDSDRIVFILDVSSSMEKKDPRVIRKKKKRSRTKLRESQKGSTRVRKRKEREEEPKIEEIDPKKISVNRQRMYRVKKELKKTLERLPRSTRFTILTFSHELEFMGGTSRLLAATSTNKRKAKDFVDKMQPWGYTWTDTALSMAFKEVKGVDTIILLTDGQPRRNDTELIPVESVYRRLVKMNRFRKVRIHTVGFFQAGSNFKNFVRKVAADHDGVCTLLE